VAAVLEGLAVDVDPALRVVASGKGPDFKKSGALWGGTACSRS
jgi:hypothetical protein